MPLYLGTKKIGIPFSKAYLGTILKYQKGESYVDVEFTTSLFPTSWTEVTTGYDYTATDDYGTWRIWADEVINSPSTYGVHKAFDGDLSNSCRMYAGNYDFVYLGIDLPENTQIKPRQIEIKQEDTSDTSVIEGLNSNGEWETIATLTKSSSAVTDTFDLTGNNFYTKFRIKLAKYSSSSTTARVYEFQITSGTIRLKAGSTDTTQKDFSVSPFPTSWTQGSLATDFSSVNEYGEWKINSNSYTKPRYVNKVFDNNTTSYTSYWESGTLSTDTTAGIVTIECPVYIKPSIIYLWYEYNSANSSLQAYNEDTDTWETLYNLKANSGKENVTISTDKFYKKFRVVGYRYSYTNTFIRIHEFQITSGTMKGA
jgi:hypothetical protein